MCNNCSICQLLYTIVFMSISTLVSRFHAHAHCYALFLFDITNVSTYISYRIFILFITLNYLLPDNICFELAKIWHLDISFLSPNSELESASNTHAWFELFLNHSGLIQK